MAHLSNEELVAAVNEINGRYTEEEKARYRSYFPAHNADPENFPQTLEPTEAARYNEFLTDLQTLEHEYLPLLDQREKELQAKLTQLNEEGQKLEAEEQRLQEEGRRIEEKYKMYDEAIEKTYEFERQLNERSALRGGPRKEEGCCTIL